MNKHGIKWWVVMLATVPLTLVSVLLSYLFTSLHLTHLENEFNNHGSNLANQIALASDYGVLSGNQAYLQKLVTASNVSADVVAISIVDTKQNLLASFGTPSLKYHENTPYKQAHKWIFNGKYYYLSPVKIRAVDTNDFILGEVLPPPDQGAPSDIIAWVIVEQTTGALNRASTQIIQRAILITLVLITLSILLALWIGRKITHPIINLSKAVAELAQGKLKTRIASTSAAELGILENGFNTMAESIDRSHSDMQHRISEATSELKKTLHTLEQQNDELAIASTRAEAANAAKSRFLANMSHEFRTPLSTIIGFSQLLGKKDISSEQYQKINFITGNAQHLLGIIDNVLMFSNLEAGNITLNNSLIDIRSCLDDVLYKLRPAAHLKDLTVTSMIYEDIPPDIFCDPILIKQILMNLLDNAIKFSPAGHIEIRVMLEEVAEDHLTIGIQIKDPGPGIPADLQSALFQMFSQIDDSATRRHGGIGLGLIMSKKLADLLGGTITVTSDEGKGSCFYFTFQCKAVTQQVPREHITLPQTTEFVLFDSNDFSRLALAHSIKHLGALCLEYASTQTFIQAIQNHTSDSKLIVLSLSRQEIRAGLANEILSQCKGLPSLILTNSNDPDTQHELYANGAGFCIPRPATTHELQQALHLLSRHEKFNRSEINSSGSNQKNINILVADDSSINQLLIAALLESHGLNYQLCGDGQEAISLANSHEFDLILIDLHMPVVDGKTASNNIRTSSPNSLTPIIALTADTITAHEEDLSQWGIDEVIIKPMNDTKLQRLLKKWLNIEIHSNKEEANTSLPINASVVDYQYVLQYARGNHALARQTLRMLKDDLTTRLSDLHRHYSCENWQELTQQVHKIHGAASYCGTQQLKERAAIVEESLKKQQTQHVSGQLTKLHTSMKEVINRIELMDLDTDR